MNTYSISSTQSISNPHYLVDSNGDPLLKNGGIIIPIDDTPLGGPTLSDFDSSEINVNIDNGASTVLPENIKPYTTSKSLPQNGQNILDVGQNRMQEICDDIPTSGAPKVIIGTKIIVPGYANDPASYIIVPGGPSSIKISYPESWTSFISTPTTFYHWYAKILCWDPNTNQYVVRWVIERIITDQVCPAF